MGEVCILSNLQGEGQQDKSFPYMRWEMDRPATQEGSKNFVTVAACSKGDKVLVLSVLCSRAL